MPGSEKIGWSLLILAGVLTSISSPTYAQADPATLNPVSGRPLSLEAIIPADVLARVRLLRDELEVIRFEMGRPKDQRPEIAVTNVAPREVLFQAFTLVREANRLHLELTGEVGTKLRLLRLPPDIRPLHVWAVVDAAYKRILIAKKKLGITTHIEENLQDSSVTPSDVFRAVIQANRQLELLLNQGPTPREVFQQVTLATNYAARLLAQFPGATQIPDAPAFEHGKRPVEVYNRLVTCYARIRAIAERSGIETLTLDIPKLDESIETPTEIKPSDVYNIATLLVSELAYLHVRLKLTRPPVEAYEPDLKVPAHVYQRAGILLLQLSELETRVKANPNWPTR